MAIEFASGSIVNTTLTQSTGTRREIVDALAAALASAGWSYVSGSGTATPILSSVATADGYQYRILLSDPGSGTCARVQISGPAGNNPSPGTLYQYLLPAASKVWRIIAWSCGLCVWAEGLTTARGHVYINTVKPTAGVLAALSNFAVMTGDGPTDSGSTVLNSFRTTLAGQGQNTQPPTQVIYGTSLWESVNVNAAAQGFPVLVGRMLGGILATGSVSITGKRYWDDAYVVSDVELAVGNSATNEAKITGTLYNTALTTKQYNSESTILTVGARTYKPLTVQSASFTNANSGHEGAVIVAIT